MSSICLCPFSKLVDQSQALQPQQTRTLHIANKGLTTPNELGIRGGLQCLGGVVHFLSVKSHDFAHFLIIYTI